MPEVQTLAVAITFQVTPQALEWSGDMPDRAVDDFSGGFGEKALCRSWRPTAAPPHRA